ncbi:MAG TPA: hypothetical protein VF897_03990 [Roseiflexaceae bacterium]
MAVAQQTPRCPPNRPLKALREGRKRLTYDIAKDTSPALSLDGTHIAFVSNKNGNNDIYIMNADGTDLTPIPDMHADEGVPTWSPDGKRLAFQTEENEGVPSWSPDGRYIAFQAEIDDDWEIHVIRVSSGELVRPFVPSYLKGYWPTWSRSPQ